jgi:hypothetical protein
LGRGVTTHLKEEPYYKIYKVSDLDDILFEMTKATENGQEIFNEELNNLYSSPDIIKMTK